MEIIETLNSSSINKAPVVHTSTLTRCALSMAAFATKTKLTSCHKDHKATTTYNVYHLALYTLTVWFSFEGDFFLPQGIQNKVEGLLESESNSHKQRA